MDRGIREWLHKHYTVWVAAHPPAQNRAPAYASGVASRHHYTFYSGRECKPRRGERKEVAFRRPAGLLGLRG